MTNLPATVSTLKREIGALTDRLAQVDRADVTVALGVLERAGMMVPGSIPAGTVVAQYSEAMVSVSKGGLSIAVSKLKIGEYPRRDHAFMPPPAELAAMARAEARIIRENLNLERDRLEALQPPPVEPRAVSDEQRERVMALRKSFRLQHAAMKARETGVVLHEPMTPEKAAYHEAILALKDRPDGITAEEAAYRRRVEAEIDALPAEQKEDSHAA